MKGFPRLDLRQQVRAGRSPLSAREASHCSRAGPSGDPGGQLSEGCHWFVTGDKWGRGRSHKRLQRGRLSHNTRQGRGAANHEKTQNLEVKKIQKVSFLWFRRGSEGQQGHSRTPNLPRARKRRWELFSPHLQKGHVVPARSNNIPSKTPQPLLCRLQRLWNTLYLHRHSSLKQMLLETRSSAFWEGKSFLTVLNKWVRLMKHHV